MLTPKKKITKREIKQDKLVESYFKFKTFYEEYQKQLLIGIGSFVLIVLLVIYLVNRSKEAEQIASTELGLVMPIYDQNLYQQAIDGNPQKKIKGLRYIVDEYGSTDAGEDAKIFLANSYFNLGKIDEALELYEDYSGSNKIFRATANAGAAACYEIKNNHEKAIEHYLKAAKLINSEAFTPTYLLNAAKLYAQNGKKDQAKKILDQIKKEYENAQPARDYERYLSEFGIEKD